MANTVKTDNDQEYPVRIHRIMNVIAHDGDVSKFHSYDVAAAKILLKDFREDSNKTD